MRKRTVNLKIKTIIGKSYEVEVEEEDSILQVKQKLAALSEIPENFLKIELPDSTEMPDTSLVKDFNPTDSLEVKIRFLVPLFFFHFFFTPFVLKFHSVNLSGGCGVEVFFFQY